MPRLYFDASLLALLAAASAYKCYTCNDKPGEDDTASCVDRITECETACSSVAMRDVRGRLHVRKFCTAPGIPIYAFMANTEGSSVCQNLQNQLRPDVGQQGSRPASALPAPPPPVSLSNDIRPLTMSDMQAPPVNPVQSTFRGKPHSEPEFLLRRHKRQLRSGWRTAFRSPVPPGGRLPLSPVRVASGARPAPPSFFSNTLLCICTGDHCNKGEVTDMVESTILKNIKKKTKSYEKIAPFF